MNPCLLGSRRRRWTWLICGLGLLGLIHLAACQSRTTPDTELILEMDATGLTGAQRTAAQNRIVEIIKNRLDMFGVRGAQVTPEGDMRIRVACKIDGDPARMVSLIGTTARLELRLVKPSEAWPPALARLDAFCSNRQRPLETDASQPETGDARGRGHGTADGDAEVPSERPFSSRLLPFEQSPPDTSYLLVAEPDVDYVRGVLADSEADSILGESVIQLAKDEVARDPVPAYRLYLLWGPPPLTGTDIETAEPHPDDQRAGHWQVEVRFTQESAETLAKLTAQNVGHYLAICLDDRVITAPKIVTKIPGGRALLSGAFSSMEASDLALEIRAGALPVGVRVVAQRAIAAGRRSP